MCTIQWGDVWFLVIFYSILWINILFNCTLSEEFPTKIYKFATDLLLFRIPSKVTLLCWNTTKTCKNISNLLGKILLKDCVIKQLMQFSCYGGILFYIFKGIFFVSSFRKMRRRCWCQSKKRFRNIFSNNVSLVSIYLKVIVLGHWTQKEREKEKESEGSFIT
jgi:hypothetical protein